MKKPKNVKNPFAGLKAIPFDLPRFASEAQEAKWWDAHKAEVAQLFERAQAIGATARMRGDTPVPETMQTTIRLIATDVERARAIAERKGLRYQTYLKMLIHEGINREDQAG